MKKRTTLADLAQSLGLSKTLVSLVLNGKGDAHKINSATQKRVIEKARELNYKPNLFARGLRSGRSNTIGLIVPDISNLFYARMARKMEDQLARQKYNLMICSSDENAETESSLISVLKDRQVDGLIVATTQQKTREFDQLQKESFPFVLVDRKSGDSAFSFVGVDNKSGAYDAMKHLIGLGHKRIGYLSISPGYISPLAERIEGYKMALKKHEIPFQKEFVREIPFNDVEASAQLALRELLKPPNSVSAIFTANNNIAISCLKAFKELKIRVPQDIALVSFDDVDVFELSDPPVTAIAQPVEDIGKFAVEVLLDKINQENKTVANVHKTLPTRLVVRRSCGEFLVRL